MTEKTQNDIHLQEPATESQWDVSKAIKNVKRHLGSQQKRKKERQISVEVIPAPSITVNSTSLIGTLSLQLRRCGVVDFA